MDQRKLEKADAKLKQKQEKKTSKDAEMTTAVKGLVSSFDFSVLTISVVNW